MKKQLLLIFFLIGTITLSFGQKPKFKKVTQEELEKTMCDYDSTAYAEYLFHGCNVMFEYNQTKGGFDIIYYYHDRIKIYNEKGIGLADQVFSYYKEGNSTDSEKISELDAYTFNLENGKIVDTKLEKDNIFDEKLSNYYSAKKFAMPAIKAGSVLDIKYKLSSPYYFKVDEFYFQKDLPIFYTEYEVSTPEYFNYNYNIKGLVMLDVTEDQSQGRISFSTIKDASNDKYRVDRKRTYETLTYTEKVKKYTASTIKGIKEEPFVYTMDNFKSSIKLELLYTQFPQAGIKYYTKTWDDITSLLHESKSFGDQLKSNYEDMKPLLKEVDSMEEEEKIATIYSRIQEQFTWNDYTGISTDKGIKKMLKEGTGNTAEINLLLVNLLQKAGIQAYPMVYKKRKSGFLNLTNPTLAELDYVVAIIIKDDKLIYLDATDKHLMVDMLPPRALNLKGVVVMGEKGQEIPITNHNKGSENKVYSLTYDGECLSGTYKQSLKDYEAYYTRNKYKTSEDYISQFKNENIVLSNPVIEDYDKINEPISLNSDIKLKGYTQEIDGKIFIDLMVGQEKFKNYFESEKRNFALFFNSKSSETKLIKIAIPEGYQVESIPETLNISTPERYIKYLIQAEVVGTEIVITIRNSFNETIISPEHYAAVKTLFETVEAKTKEKIVLTKS